MILFNPGHEVTEGVNINFHLIIKHPSIASLDASTYGQRTSSSDMVTIIDCNNTLQSIRSLVAVILIVFRLKMQRTFTNLDSPFVHIYASPKVEFYILLQFVWP